MNTFGMVINGQIVESDRTFDVINPATETVVAACSDCSSEQLEEAVRAAHQAFGDWQNNQVKRKKALIGCARAVKAQIRDLAELLTLEQGKPLRNALHEVSGIVHWFQQAAGMKVPVDV
ncbi:MAG: acyl-CoA reductase-like NAD-dependent aldehyde dehydrogenase, partial [Candidatus Latescibacterota bacterium]